MGFTHQLATFRLNNHPFHVLRDCDDPEGRGMAIGGLPQLLHHANEVLIVPGNEFPMLVQARFPRPGSRRPIGSRTIFFQCLPLPQITQPDQRLMADAEFVIAPVNHDSLHGRSHL